MPVSKQTTDLTLSLRAVIYRIRQLIRERQNYSKSKHRELAKLLREGNRDEFARIKTEDVIANDDLIRALEILELTCEQLSVRVNLLDHLAFARGKRPASQRRKENQDAKRRSGAAGQGGGSGGGWGLWKIFGFGGSGPASAGSNASSELPPSVDRQKGREEHNSDHAKTESDDEAYETYIEPELDRSAAIIFYTYPRLPRDIPGLPELRAKLALRWGNDFANRAQGDEPPVKIPEELVERLQVRRPPAKLVDMYLKEIARSHGIPWGQGDEETAGDKEEDGHRDSVQKTEQDNPPKLNDALQSNDESVAKVHDSGPASAEKNNGIPEVDELARRFAALKR
ncbi:hypothetical protein VTO42DRAFT_5825 [Malbranchea cinnamomea]